MNACLAGRPALVTARRCARTRDKAAACYSTRKTPKLSTPAAIIKHHDTLHFAYSSDSTWAAKTRSLLRAILRECTCLPDPNARLFMSQYAMSRFRTYAFKTHQHCNDPAFGARLAAKFKEGRGNLSRLARANQGDRKALLKILLYTYGRLGPKKYALMEPLMPTTGNAEIKKILKQNAEIEGNDAYDSMGQERADLENSGQEVKNGMAERPLPGLTPSLTALARSQKEANPPNDTGRNPKQLKPVIPELNARLLPMPKKRVKNMTMKWYANILDRLLPPLPPAEWEQLRSWAFGIEEPMLVTSRRKNIHPISKRVHVGANTALETIVVQGRVDNRAFNSHKGHFITSRFMQRLWAQVFSQCCLMDWDDGTNKWKVTWGHHELHHVKSESMGLSESKADLGTPIAGLDDVEPTSALGNEKQPNLAAAW